MFGRPISVSEIDCEALLRRRQQRGLSQKAVARAMFEHIAGTGSSRGEIAMSSGGAGVTESSCLRAVQDLEKGRRRLKEQQFVTALLAVLELQPEEVGLVEDLPDDDADPVMKGLAPAVLAQVKKEQAMIFAVGARNGVEDLHAAGAFDDAQAPAFNRLMRSRLYEVLVAMGTPGDDATSWLVMHSELNENDPLGAALPPVVATAAEEFAESIDLEPEVSEQLIEAARVGVLEAVDVFNRAATGDEGAYSQLVWLARMVPDYWEEPELSSEFNEALQLDSEPA